MAKAPSVKRYRLLYVNIDANELTIGGVEDGKVYYVDQIVTLTGGTAPTLTVNDEKFENGGILPENKDAVYVIKATGADGQTVSCTITMMPITKIVTGLGKVSPDTVLVDQQDSLLVALATLKQINTTHATVAQKDEISAIRARIEACVTFLASVKELESRVYMLPASLDHVTPEQGRSIEECQVLFNGLSSHGKEIFDAAMKAKLVALNGLLTPTSYKDAVSGATINLSNSSVSFLPGTKVSVTSVTDPTELKRLEETMKSALGANASEANKAILWINGCFTVNRQKGQLPGSAQITIPRTSLSAFVQGDYTTFQLGHLRDGGTFEIISCTLDENKLQFTTAASVILFF